MKAKIKRFHSPDINDLENYEPDDKDHFGFLLQLIVNIEDCDQGEESFDLLVCTTRWLDNTISKAGAIFGEHYLIVDKFEFNKIKSVITGYIENLEEDNWDALASKIDRIAKWEFRDYEK